MKALTTLILMIIAALSLASCGSNNDEGSDDAPPATGYVLGGYVSGLDGTLVLMNNRANDLTIKSDGYFVFDALVANDATYAVTVKSEPGLQICPTSNASGTMSSSGVSNVYIACKNWQRPSGIWDNLSPVGSGATSSALSVDSSGGAVVLWQQPDSIGTSRIYAARLSSGVWVEPASRSDAISDSGYDATSPSVDMGPDGVAVAAWLQTGASGLKRVYASVLSGGLWGVPAAINPDGADASNVTVAMDASGNAVVAWQQDDAGGTSRLYASTRSVAGTWTHPSGITDSISSSASNASNPHAAAAGGKAIVVWQQEDAAADMQIFKAEHTSGAWSLPAGLSDNLSPSGYDATLPRVAMASAQSAVIAWLQRDSSLLDRVYSAHLSGTTWSVPSGLTNALSPSGTAASNLRVAMGSTGNAVAIWQQPTSSGTSGIFGSVMRDWLWTDKPSSTSDAISPSGTSASEPDVAMDSGARAVALWKQPNTSGVYRILKAEYNDRWHSPSTPDTIYKLSPSDTDASSAHIAMNASLQCVASWQQSDGTDAQVFQATLGY